ncbi:PREDICTED: uncharacterized protein LOC106120014 [Papilio xuthus]|uniref:Uncharacterized protein LOC106120014 n=2 Tax=Papilio xuthus TaxID=66420 RepID=A0AAJ6ZDZ2_PAPXU|nr:PREDICTED: uncharacterized protein LOC106120014 [Papilio xuthus]
MQVLFILFALICGAFGAWESGLRVRFGVGMAIGTEAFIPIPRTLSAAKSQGWAKTARPSGPLPSLVMYCADDRMMCALYDPEGVVAGIQIAIAQIDISGSTLNWKTQGFVEWTATTADGTKLKYWAIQQYFVSKATLDMSKEDRMKMTNSSSLLREGAVWLPGFNGKLMRISAKSADLEKSSFTRQACLPLMGRHYYYKMTPTTSCASDKLLPWFPIAHSGQTIATGLILHGKLAFNKRTKKNWFENPDRAAVKAIVPRGPQCLYNLADNPGVVTIHSYYVEAPWTINCTGN